LAGKRHTAAFVIGSMAGGLVGAALALWKTPQSGAELRAQIASAADPNSPENALPRHSSRTLGVVEQVLAPIVGVELGKTANNSGPIPPALPQASDITETTPPPAPTVPPVPPS